MNRKDRDQIASEEDNVWPEPSSASLLFVCHSEQ